MSLEREGEEQAGRPGRRVLNARRSIVRKGRMRRFSIGTCLILFTCLEDYGQPADPSPSFDVASIEIARPVDLANEARFGCSGSPGSKEPNRWTCRAVSLSTLIGTAYELRPYQMSSLMPSQAVSPAISQGTQFDIFANVPDGTTHEQALRMQQNLLKERFKLSIHFEKRNVDGYEIIVARNGPKMKSYEPVKDTSDDPPMDSTVLPPLDADGFPAMSFRSRPITVMMNGRARFMARNSSMAQLIDIVSSQLRAPAIDATGLDGKYEIDLKWFPGDMGAGTAEFSGPSLTSALQDQLGLKVQAKRIPVDMLVVDHVEKMPTEN